MKSKDKKRKRKKKLSWEQIKEINERRELKNKELRGDIIDWSRLDTYE